MSQGGRGSWVQQNVHDDKKQHEKQLARARALVDVLNEAGKAAMAINGGAAVAMGALLQAIIDRPSLHDVRVALLWGIAFTVLGVLLAAVTFLLRYVSLWKRETREVVGNSWGLAALVLGLASVVLFTIGVFAPLVTALVTLH